MAMLILLAELGGPGRQEGDSAAALLPGRLRWQYLCRVLLLTMLLLTTTIVFGVRSASAAHACAAARKQRR
jgi:hypothetical protein